jgi:hypothetical protein
VRLHEPPLATVEYWLVTRAEVFQCFAAQAREAAAAPALADEEAGDGGIELLRSQPSLRFGDLRL